MFKKVLHILLLVSSFTGLNAQISNDECVYSKFLGSIDSYCSGDEEFSNIGATASIQEVGEGSCIYGEITHDVWFTFIPKAPVAYVSVEGLEKPSVAFYAGDCADLTLLGCKSSPTESFAEINVSDLVIGQEYTVRIDSRSQAVGSFKLCVETFPPVKSPESDCPDAIVLCDKSSFQIENLNSVGKLKNELTGSCVQGGQSSETASVWYIWTCKDAGTLEFTLTPNNPNSGSEDLDFVVYELPGGLKDCANRQSVRCMLSGESAGFDSSPCYGATGLRAGEKDTEEFAGCNDGSNNFVAPLNMESGKSYGLIVNNYSQSGYGFSIKFGGTGTFLGPEPDFSIEAVNAFECDKTITFIDKTQSLTDPIIRYTWNYGDGAKEQPSSTPQRGDVIYDSFGDKLASLTVETKRGCVVTEIKEFYIEACCGDLPDLEVEADANDVTCFDTSDGVIFATAKLGQPPYKYSLSDGKPQRNPNFLDLPVGIYSVTVVDKKGCEGKTEAIIQAPDSIIVNAGPDQEVDLGYSTFLDASYTPVKDGDSIYWFPLDSFLSDCVNCLNPEVIPPGTTTYTVTVQDTNGCKNSAEVTLRVNDERPIFFPNVFSPNDDGNNDLFSIFGGPAIREIKSLRIFDRWGNMVFNEPAGLGDDFGWDGTFNGMQLENGVYTWVADVLFIDRKSIIFKGDVTLLR